MNENGEAFFSSHFFGSASVCEVVLEKPVADSVGGRSFSNFTGEIQCVFCSSDVLISDE